jgi:mannitol operon transcriptional antiterminator
MQLLAAPRSEVWPGDGELDYSDVMLIDRLVEHICAAYGQPALSDDRTLRDGLVNHILPACLRQRFQLWFPSLLNEGMARAEYPFEYRTALELAEIVRQQKGIELPANEISNLAMLLRAAFIRTRPYRFRQVIVVCPSGMATAQLLVARLEARFPRLGNLKVVSLRQLSLETAASADLILSTVPLTKNIVENFNVIQVHPLLLPADIDAITRFLS